MALVAVAVVMVSILGGITLLTHVYSLNGIKNKTVGNGQHGTARWATKKEIHDTYVEVPFNPKEWRKGNCLPTEQGLVVGCKGTKFVTTALVDTGDVHALMIGAAGVGKTAYLRYPVI